MVFINLGEVRHATVLITSIKRKVIGANLESEENLLNKILMQLDVIENRKTKVTVGDHIVRLLDGRHFFVTYVNNQILPNGGVFSAKAADGIRDRWGGSLHDLTEGVTFIKLDEQEALKVASATNRMLLPLRKNTDIEGDVSE